MTYQPRRIGAVLAVLIFVIGEVVGWVYYSRHPSPALATALMVACTPILFLLPTGLRNLDLWLLRQIQKRTPRKGE